MRNFSLVYFILYERKDSFYYGSGHLFEWIYSIIGWDSCYHGIQSVIEQDHFIITKNSFHQIYDGRDSV